MNLAMKLTAWGGLGQGFDVAFFYAVVGYRSALLYLFLFFFFLETKTHSTDGFDCIPVSRTLEYWYDMEYKE